MNTAKTARWRGLLRYFIMARAKNYFDESLTRCDGCDDLEGNQEGHVCHLNNAERCCWAINQLVRQLPKVTSSFVEFCQRSEIDVDSTTVLIQTVDNFVLDLKRSPVYLISPQSGTLPISDELTILRYLDREMTTNQNSSVPIE